jgi:hypothetical protein
MEANISKPLRITYVAIGVIMVIVPLIMVSLDPWIRIVAPIVGLSAIASGATGW